MAKWMSVKDRHCRMCGGKLRWRKRKSGIYETECASCWDRNEGLTLESALWAASKDVDSGEILEEG